MQRFLVRNAYATAALQWHLCSPTSPRRKSRISRFRGALPSSGDMLYSCGGWMVGMSRS